MGQSRGDEGVKTFAHPLAALVSFFRRKRSRYVREMFDAGRVDHDAGRVDIRNGRGNRHEGIRVARVLEDFLI
jgi:hypothetical protein